MLEAKRRYDLQDYASVEFCHRMMNLLEAAAGECTCWKLCSRSHLLKVIDFTHYTSCYMFIYRAVLSGRLFITTLHIYSNNCLK